MNKIVIILFLVFLFFCGANQEVIISKIKFNYVDSTRTLPYTRIDDLSNSQNKGLTPDEIIAKFGKANGFIYDNNFNFALFYSFHIPPEDLGLEDIYQKRWRKQFDHICFVFKDNRVDYITHSILK
jgi:hypothetical protein